MHMYAHCDFASFVCFHLRISKRFLSFFIIIKNKPRIAESFIPFYFVFFKRVISNESISVPCNKLCLLIDCRTLSQVAGQIMADGFVFKC